MVSQENVYGLKCLTKSIDRNSGLNKLNYLNVIK